ncbi:MAG: uncharacterized protein QOJ92_1274 [Frankiales bacterium]|nr:uncharacterized protein [Frankiales bacterium]MDX6274064.1 uncharacterized protein [Frankiales bacterium]
MVRGAGTALNVVAVLVGSGAGVLLRGRLPQRTRDVVTDALGLVVLLVAASAAVDVASADLVTAVGSSAPTLIVLGALVVGGITGSLLRLEQRLEEVGEALRRRMARDGGTGRFVEGFVLASLVFCVGPLAVLGSFQDGLGQGIDLLALKSTLDCFAAMAFAAALGWGVAASAISVGVLQGVLTVVGFFLGDLLPAAEVAALNATGGLLLVGVALRLLRIKPLPVADLLPALAVAPALTWLVATLR